MPTFNVTRRMPYSADQMYAVAEDIAAYRDFVPLLRRSNVRNRVTLADGRTGLDAELVVTYKKLRIEETTNSRVILDPVNRIVHAHSEDGPVKMLDSVCKIRELPDGTSEIDFTIDYTLKSRSLQFLLSGMFDLVVRKIVSCFEERARELYGPAPAIS